MRKSPRDSALGLHLVAAHYKHKKLHILSLLGIVCSGAKESFGKEECKLLMKLLGWKHICFKFYAHRYCCRSNASDIISQ